jgi:hypothetical protein
MTSGWRSGGRRCESALGSDAGSEAVVAARPAPADLMRDRHRGR